MPGKIKPVAICCGLCRFWRWENLPYCVCCQCSCRQILLMPLFALCRHPGCGCRIPFGEKYCDKHKADASKYAAPKKRLTAHQRGYTSRWRRISQEFLKAHPLCAECERNGKVTPATCVDHIVPHKGNPKLFWDQKNWQPLCQSCHSRKTASEDGGFGNKQK